MLHVENIHFSYGDKKILNGLSFSVCKGEIVAFIGISGSGKTTLFRLITGLIQPEKGEILIGGKRSPEGAELTTYMHQKDLLLPWRTVLDNLLLCGELGGKKERDPTLIKQALELFQQVRLKGHEEAYPHQLSEGMRQRVSLARALLQNRPLLLLDEPFASLDVIIREELYTLLREIRCQYQKTMIMVTHDFRDAMALADRFLVLSKGQIVATHLLTPEIKKDAGAAQALIQQIRGELSYESTL